MNIFNDLIRVHLEAALGRHIRVAAIFLGALVVALYALAFLLMAAQDWLLQWYQSPIKADLTVAAALALLAAVIGGVAQFVRRAPTPPVPTPISLAVAVPIAARIAPKLLNSKFLGIASVVLGGVLIGREFSKK
jgi:hypothetical protein